jgi:hypothetical protein
MSRSDRFREDDIAIERAPVKRDSEMVMNALQAPVFRPASLAERYRTSVPGSMDQIECACECCARLLVPPPRKTRLGRRDRINVIRMSLGQMLFHFKGLPSAYRTIRPRVLARRNEEAVEAFVTSFRFCNRCRGFICTRCWNKRQNACRGCVAVAKLRIPDRPLEMPGLAPAKRSHHWRRRTISLGAPLRRGRVWTATCFAVLAWSLVIGVLETACVLAAPIR